MAEKVELQVELKSNLDKVIDATKSMKLDKGQEERLARYSKGAQLALDSGDLKTFQRNFNGLMKLFKEAASVTGKVSEEIKKLTEKQTALSQEINRLKDKKTDLEGKLTKDRGRLTANAAKEFAKSNVDAKKIKTSDGRVATRNEIIELQQALNKFLKDTGRTISEVTNADLKQIKTASGVSLDGRSSMFAMNRYSKAEQEYTNNVKNDLIATEGEITTQEENYVSLTAELDRMSNAASSGAESISKLYAEISKLGDTTNKKVTDELNDQKINKTDRTGASDLGSINSGIGKEGASLKGAFKQFTLYNIALNALKTAGREAVQTVKELDKYLTEQAMVTGMTREETYSLVRSYQDLALQCGATTKEIAQVATEYMKQGKTIQDSLVLTQAAVSAAKVARVSVGDSVNYLTTALNGFQLSAEDAMKVSDKFAAVAASSATDYDELAIALSKVASQANLAGMSIDYTTALLTKGLETTREAPETMGTALKTIIARMRELGDYGETLDDGMDINNVESQLKYVGIALRDSNGELRSTEDVLDELGHKWDGLNKNQQAAIAKALAGTRQQSRLIAMMEDYERVTELQEISQRSAGATAAQAGTYLEGIEAAMNKIQVAWEKIVMTVTDSDLIISTFEWISTVLDNIGEFLSNDVALGATLAVVGSIILANVGNRLRELEISRLQQQYALQQNKLENEKNIIAQKAIVNEKRSLVEKIKSKIQDKESLKTEKLKTIEDKKQLKLEAEKNGNTAEAKRLADEISADEKEVAELTKEINTTKEVELEKAQQSLEQEERALDIYEKQSTVLKSQESFWDSMITGATGLITPLIMIWGWYKKIATGINGVIEKKKAEQRQTEANIATDTTETGIKMASSAATIPVAGWVIAALILAAFGLAIGLTIAALSSLGNNKSAENTAKQINELSAEIYKLTEKANALNQIADSFDNIDNKLIKTNADLKEMNSLLDQAADKLSDEIEKDEDIGYGAGVSELDYYNSFSTEKGKRQALETIEKNNRDKANEARAKVRAKINAMSSEELEKFLDENTTNAEIRQAQDEIYAINNNDLYEYIDAQKESKQMTDAEAAAVEALTQALLEEMSVEEAWAYAKSGNGAKVRELAKTLEKLSVVVKNLDKEDVTVNVGEVLTSDDYSLKDQVKAFIKTRDTLLREYGEFSEEFQAFNDSFSQYNYFATLGENTLDFIDSVGLTIDELNNLYGAWENLQKKGVKITQDVWEDKFDEYITELSKTQGDVLAATKTVFGQYLDDSEDALNAFISAYGDLVQVGILNMGQNMDKIKNSINNFYEKALEWNEMSESDKSEFIQDNAELFSDGKLLEAFESGDYNAIEKALKNNVAFAEKLNQARKEVAQELKIEEARERKDRNEAYIAQLKEYEKYLNDVENLFKASLELRLEQEQNQLDEYKNYLQEQQSALEDSLSKRKEAYEKYFSDIDKEQEDKDYEEQANLLVSNLSKLGSSTNASAMQQKSDLEKQFKELEKERLQTLRERAREAVLENMDSQIEEINDKFDKLLESNQALLAAMQGELENPLEYITELISTKIEKGATALEVEDYIGSLESTYGSVLDNNVDWDAIRVHEENNQLFLNVNGTEVALDTNNEQNLYQAIMKALREVGVR